jgi:hypothetical protein
VRVLRTGEELRAVSEAGVGFVFNDVDKRRKMLHAASCRWLSEASVPPAKLWFADLHEAEAPRWTVRHEALARIRGGATDRGVARGWR